MSGLRRVLIVDGDETMREMLQAVLDLEEFDVATAADPERALAMVGEFEPDMVVIDGCSPDLDGTGLSRSLRAQHDTAHLPILLLVPGDDAPAANADAAWDDELARPISPLELIERLATLDRQV